MRRSGFTSVSRAAAFAPKEQRWRFREKEVLLGHADRVKRAVIASYWAWSLLSPTVPGMRRPPPLHSAD